MVLVVFIHKKCDTAKMKLIFYAWVQIAIAQCCCRLGACIFSAIHNGRDLLTQASKPTPCSSCHNGFSYFPQILYQMVVGTNS